MYVTIVIGESSVLQMKFLYLAQQKSVRTALV
jgi:hypothetical protein